MSKSMKYVIAAVCASAAFLALAPVAPAAIMTMSAAQWLFPTIGAAVAGFIGLGPVSKFVENNFFSTKAPTPPGSRDGSIDESHHSSEREVESELSSRAALLKQASDEALEKIEKEATQESEEAPTYMTRSAAKALRDSQKSCGSECGCDNKPEPDAEAEAEEAQEVEAEPAITKAANEEDAAPAAEPKKTKKRIRRRRKLRK